MSLGKNIKALRESKNIKQEDLANILGVSIQSISRWENEQNYPDISILPSISKYFNVTTDYLLDIERRPNMAKLLKTVETFELNTKEEAEKMISNFKNDKFPILKDYKIIEKDGKILLEVMKEFNTDINDMKFN